MLIGFIVSTVAFYAIFISDPMSVRFIDQNLSVRLVLIKDAIDGFFDSYMIGVGYGTESIKNYYYMFKNPVFHNPDDSGFLHLAVHNSFATTAYRLGIIGFVSLLIFLFEIITCIKSTRNNQTTMIVLFLCFYTVCFQNPALESYIYMVGCYLMLSGVWALYLIEKHSKNK